MQPAPGPGASWGQWESTGGCGGRWIWAGRYNPWCFWEQKALHQCAEILLLFSISNHSHTEQEQRRALAPSLPLAEPSAQLDSSPGSLAPLLPVQLGGLSLTDCAPLDATWVPLQCLSTGQRQQGWSVTAHPQVKVCADRTRGPPPGRNLTKGLWQVTATKCSQSAAQAVKHRLPSPGASQSIQQHRGWE